MQALLIFMLVASFWIDLFPRQTKDLSKNKWYDDTVHLVSSLGGVDCPMPHQLSERAHQEYAWLDRSFYYETSLLSNPGLIRTVHLQTRNESASLVAVPTADGKQIDCTYFNRNSDTILFVGEGFTNSREVMSPFLDVFPDVDIVLFDFRGQGYKEQSSYDPSAWSCNLLKCFCGVDPSVVCLGEVEDLDVQAVVSFFTGQRVKALQHACEPPRRDTDGERTRYRNVFGLGVCYSAFIFLKTASLYRRIDIDGKACPLFDKLILDGCWLSLEAFVEKIKEDLWRIQNPQQGGLLNDWLLGKPLVQEIIYWIVRYGIGLKIDGEISMLDYLPYLRDTDLFFIYGKDDEVIYRHEFEAIWNAVPASVAKHAMITSDPHVRNHIKNKQLYAFFTRHFLHDGREWLSSLTHRV